MNYKNIVRNQKTRFVILKLLSFLPDAIMLKWQYRIKMGRKLNLQNPCRYTEKLQWYKSYYRNPLMGQCVDKYEVRKYLESKGVASILNVLYGVYDSADDINFDVLPDRFVVKTTDGGGGENIIICRDKSLINTSEIRQELSQWMNKKNINAGREWAYTCITKSRIIIEEYLENEDNPEAGIADFKIFCFDGKPYCIVYDIDRYIEHKRNFYDLNWNCLSVSSDCLSFEDSTVKPEGLERMLKVAEVLSEGFPFVRVDLYYLRGRVYFGELTFYPWSGYVQFNPDNFDYILGEQFVLPVI